MHWPGDYNVLNVNYVNLTVKSAEYKQGKVDER